MITSTPWRSHETLIIVWHWWLLIWGHHIPSISFLIIFNILNLEWNFFINDVTLWKIKFLVEIFSLTLVIEIFWATEESVETREERIRLKVMFTWFLIRWKNSIGLWSLVHFFIVFHSIVIVFVLFFVKIIWMLLPVETRSSCLFNNLIKLMAAKSTLLVAFAVLNIRAHEELLAFNGSVKRREVAHRWVRSLKELFTGTA